MEDDIDRCEAKEEQVRKGKQFGIPEIDPDALPSSLVQKYLTLVTNQFGGKDLNCFLAHQTLHFNRLFPTHPAHMDPFVWFGGLIESYYIKKHGIPQWWIKTWTS